MGLISKKLLFKNYDQVRSISYQRLKNWYAALIKPLQAKAEGPPYKHITQIGDPVLRSVADPIPIQLVASPETNFLVKRMTNVFRKYDCVGLSAPQIGIPLRVFIMEFNERHRKSYSSSEQKAMEMDLLPFTVVINPYVKIRDYTKVAFPESCESVRGFAADVPRYREIELNGLNEKGDLISVFLRGWPARIAQHEVDHLNGKLYVDIMDRKTFCCSCWQDVNEHNGKISIPFGPK